MEFEVRRGIASGHVCTSVVGSNRKQRSPLWRARRKALAVIITSSLLTMLALPLHAEDDLDDPPKHLDGAGGSVKDWGERVVAYAPSLERIAMQSGVPMQNGVQVYTGFASTGARFGNPSNGSELNREESDKEKAEDEDATEGPCNKQVIKGNPINIATGNKLEPELDFAAEGEKPLYLKRTYNHHWDGIGLFGWKWLSNFDYRLSFESSYSHGPAYCYARPSIAECSNTSGVATLWAHRPDGRKLRFVKAADGIFYENKPAPIARIVPQPDGSWRLYSEENDVETYSQGGYPLTVLNEAGIGWTFTHGGLNGTQLQSVNHTSGRKVEFIWTDDELREVRDPAGRIYRFTYWAQKEEPGIHIIKTVAMPGGTTVTYHYADDAGEQSNNSGYALTGKSYNGMRYSTFGYLGSRAISTEHAGGVERYSFTYTSNADGTVTVGETNPLGKKADYVFKDGKILSVTGLPSNSCAGAYREVQYDAHGHEDLVADFNGNFTNYDYAANGQLLKKVEAFGSDEARTITYAWDQSRNRISSVVVEGVARTDYTYTTGNRVDSVTITDLSSNGATGQQRKTQYGYSSHPNGLLATTTVDGPLPDDTVTYTYSAAGDLTEVRNALGHAIRYGNHNALGQPGWVMGVNGEITEFSYDDRGRLVTTAPVIDGVAQPTTVSYDGFGRPFKVQTPDGRVRIREYDAAWRVVREYEQESAGTYAVTRYTYNNASLVTFVSTERTTALTSPSTTPSLSVPSIGANGSYTVSWSAVAGSESYVLEESVNGGAWSVVHDDSATSKAFGGKSSGSYAYRVKACNAAGCAAFSGAHTVQVVHTPASAPTPSAPSQSTAGSYTVSWTSVAEATRYQLEESVDGGSWTLIHDEAATSRTVAGKNAGTYGYRVRACNVVGCGPYSGTVTVQETDPPGAAPNLFGPSVNSNGHYTVYWTSVATATVYRLEESINGGAWTLVHNSPETSRYFSGKGSGNFSYRVRACNVADCGPTSSSIVVAQAVYGAEFIGQSVPDYQLSPGGTYAVSVQMRNTGNTAWTAAEAYNLGSQYPQDNVTWGLSRVGVPGSVAPGEVATFNFNIVAPQTSDLYTFQWRMVRDGVTWFGALTPKTLISVGTWEPSPGPECQPPAVNCQVE